MLYFSVIFLTYATFTNALTNYSIDKIYIPHTIQDVVEQVKDEHHTNPKTQQEFDSLLAGSEYFLPNFDEDVVKVNSARFEQAKALYDMKKKKDSLGNVVVEDKATNNILRQSKQDKKLLRRALRRAFALMTQFVYAARYKLTYGQVLRKHYKKVTEYKIGYCFALMRDIRAKELLLYSTMHYNYAQHKEELYNKYWSSWWGHWSSNTYSYADFHSYFMVYEKICKLDVNMLDTVNLVKKYIKMRRTQMSKEVTNTTTTTTNKYGSDISDSADQG